MTYSDAAFWIALLQIIGVNIVLSGDNAVVIALAARSLPPKQQKQAVLWGSGAAVVMRIVLTIVALELLTLPYLKLIGAALLLWIGIQLLAPEEEGAGEGTASATSGMFAAIRTILIADLVMSLDNVIGVAAAAKGNITLLILGLLISIPLVIFGSTLLMKVMERWPIIITIGAGLLGWVAGEMAATDPAISAWVEANAAWLHYGAPILGAAIVIAVGKWLANRSAEEEIDRPIVDLASASDQHDGKALAGATSRVLLVADDTPLSLRGVSRFVDDLRQRGEKVAVDLLNVQIPVTSVATTFIDEGAIKGVHHDEGMKAIEPARALLEKAGISSVVHIGVGDLTHVVLHYAKTLGASKIYLTETARGKGDDLTEATAHMSQHSNLPLTMLR